VSTSVLISGGGPNGLFLACELALGGVPAIVLEKEPAITDRQRANGLVGQVVRVLDRRGIHARLAGADGPPRPVPRFMFGGLALNAGQLADSPLYTVAVPQQRLEEVLQERALELGVEVRRGHEVTGFTQTDDGVSVAVSGASGPSTMNTTYLVGADGGKSAVRKLAGIGFPGVTVDHTVSLGIRADVPDELRDRLTGGLDLPGYGKIPPFFHHRTERGVFAYAPFPTGTLVNTLEWEEHGHGEPATIDDVRASIGRVLGVEVPLVPPAGAGPHLARRLVGGNTRLAERYRDRRVLLLGDAAHVHSAIGGPGLNLGLQDALNLGWKLAAVVRGDAPDALLDSYEAERRPAAVRVGLQTQAQGALVGPGPQVTALREVFAELLRDASTVRRIAALMAGADVRYPARGDHPLAGYFAPDVTVRRADGARVRLAELTRSGKALFIGDETFSVRPDAHLDVVTGTLEGGALHGARGLLLRPDTWVAWAGDDPESALSAVDSLRGAVVA
jgi:2-polyprenyl-6-methoxyphenol hydroxylase-like FAD-dependent oxidoreductase